MRRHVALLALLAFPAGVGACSSLLGDFSVGPGGSPDSGPDGGTQSDASDATVDTLDGNTPLDAPSESADAPTDSPTDAPGDSPTDALGDSPMDATDATGNSGDSQAPSSDAGDSGQDATANDGSSDGPAPSSDAADSGPDAAAPPLACSAWQYGSPIQVVSLQGQPAGARTLAAPPAVFQAPSSDNMYVVLSPAPSNFQVYQVSLSRAMSQASMQTTAHGWVGAWLYTHDGMAVVSADSAGSGQTSLVITDLPTTLGGGSTLPAGVPVWTFSGNTGYFSAAAQELAPGTYDYLYTDSPSNNFYELFAGNNTSSTVPPVTVAMGSTRVDNGPQIVHVGTTSYVFEGGSPGQSSAAIWVLPDNATSATGPRMIPGKYTPLGIGMGPNSSPSRMNVAFADLQITSNDAGALQFGAAVLHAGSLDVSQANTFGLADIPATMSFPSLLNVPVGGGTHLWQGDNFVLVGTPFGGAAAGGGIGLIWVDANGNTRATTLPNNVLTSDSYVSQVTASLQTGFSIVGLAAFNVVWSDRLSDANGAYDVVYANQLDCH
jgi:hypothetical protein